MYRNPILFGRALILVAALLLSFPTQAADVSRRELVDILRPDRIGQIALSPDGRHLAYVVREKNAMWLVIRELDGAEAKTTVRVDVDEMVGLVFRTVNFSVRLTFLGWANNDALVYAIALPPRGVPFREEVRVVDASGRNDRKLVDASDLEAVYYPPIRTPSARTPADYGNSAQGDREMQMMAPEGIPIPRRPRVIGLDASEPDVVFVEAVGNPRADSESFRIDLRTAKRERISQGNGDGRILYDWHGRARVFETPRVRMPDTMLGWGKAGPPPPRLDRQSFRFRLADQNRGWTSFEKLVGRSIAEQFSHEDEDYYRPRSFPLAFDADPNVLYFASNVGRDTYGIYGLDMKTGARTSFAVEVDGFDVVDPSELFSARPLVFDRSHHVVGARTPGLPPATRWFDRDLGQLQAAADARFPGRQVQVIDWSDSKKRALLLVSGPSDPGRYFIFEDGAPAKATEILRRAGWVTSDRIARVAPFAFETADRVRLTGAVTIPSWSRVTPPPLIVRWRDVPGRSVAGQGFSREAQGLAALGFMVLEVNYRGSSGFGLAHRDAIREGFDRIPIADVHEAMRWVAARYPYDKRRVASIGDGFGGYLALRASQLYPKEFRCVVSLNAPSDLARWVTQEEMSSGGGGIARPLPVPTEAKARRQAFFGLDTRMLENISVLPHAEDLQRPVFIIQDVRRMDIAPDQNIDLRNRLKKADRDPEYLELSTAFVAGDPDAAAKVFAQIGGFLNANVYDYRVEVGTEREVK